MLNPRTGSLRSPPTLTFPQRIDLRALGSERTRNLSGRFCSRPREETEPGKARQECGSGTLLPNRRKKRAFILGCSRVEKQREGMVNVRFLSSSWGRPRGLRMEAQMGAHGTGNLGCGGGSDAGSGFSGWGSRGTGRAMKGRGWAARLEARARGTSTSARPPRRGWARGACRAHLGLLLRKAGLSRDEA